MTVLPYDVARRLEETGRYRKTHLAGDWYEVTPSDNDYVARDVLDAVSGMDALGMVAAIRPDYPAWSVITLVREAMLSARDGRDELRVVQCVASVVSLALALAGHGKDGETFWTRGDRTAAIARLAIKRAVEWGIRQVVCLMLTRDDITNAVGRDVSDEEFRYLSAALPALIADNSDWPSLVRQLLEAR